MRADARSLMIYWRRTYLNTERKVAPSSVFKKGSFSHRSINQNHTESNIGVATKQDILGLRYYFTKSSLPVPVLRLQSQTSASARSCFIGPSQDGLICRNIHYTKKKIRNRSDTTVSVRLNHIVYNSFLYLFQSSVYVHLHLHDKQVWGLDELLHHFCPVNAAQRQIWVWSQTLDC